MKKTNKDILVLFNMRTEHNYDYLRSEFVKIVDLPPHMMQGMERDFDDFCWSYFDNIADIKFQIEDSK